MEEKHSIRKSTGASSAQGVTRPTLNRLSSGSFTPPISTRHLDAQSAFSRSIRRHTVRHVCRIYWPLSASSLPSGYLVGWHISNLECCVAAVISGDVELPRLEHAVKNLVTDKSFSEFWQYCNGPPTVLGVWNAAGDSTSGSADAHMHDSLDQRATSNFWITITKSSSPRLPVLSDISCDDMPYPSSAQIVLYKRPNPGSYLSHRPFTFDFALLSHHDSAETSQTLSDFDFTLRQLNSSSQLLRSLNSVLESDDATFSSEASDSKSQTSSQRRMSSSDSSKTSHNAMSSDGSSLRRRRVHSRSTSAREVDSSETDKSSPAQVKQSTSGFCSRFCRKLLRTALTPFVWLLLVLRAISEILMELLEHPLPAFLGGGSIKKHTSFGQQLHKRLAEMCCWPDMWLQTHARRWSNDAHAAADFISFWSSFWQVVADVVAGVVLMICMQRFPSQFLIAYHQGGRFLHLEVMRANIVWLMGIPAGLKLNHNLNQCFGSMVLFGIDFWDVVTTVMTPWEPTIVFVLSCFGILGASLVLALCSDLLSLATSHINFVYTAFSKLYSIEIKALSSLWKLFRGKKQNVLRQRIDSQQFDMDQLLVGTILFTLIFFLFPTIATYFFFFSYVRLVVVFMKAAIWLLLFFFNYFPFCGMMIYIVDRSRLPGGVRFNIVPASAQSKEPVDAPSMSFSSVPSSRAKSALTPLLKQTRLSRAMSCQEPLSPQQAVRQQARSMSSCTYLELYNSDIPLSTLFFSYHRELVRVFRHYRPGRIAKSLGYGLPYPEPPPLFKRQSSQNFWQRRGDADTEENPKPGVLSRVRSAVGGLAHFFDENFLP